MWVKWVKMCKYLAPKHYMIMSISWSLAVTVFIFYLFFIHQTIIASQKLAHTFKNRLFANYKCQFPACLEKYLLWVSISTEKSFTCVSFKIIMWQKIIIIKSPCGFTWSFSPLTLSDFSLWLLLLDFLFTEHLQSWEARLTFLYDICSEFLVELVWFLSIFSLALKRMLWF